MKIPTQGNRIYKKRLKRHSLDPRFIEQKPETNPNRSIDFAKIFVVVK